MYVEKDLLEAYQNDCRQMAKDGTLTHERQFLAMMMYLPQDFIKKQVKPKTNLRQ